jgi:hypothetical protein
MVSLVWIRDPTCLDLGTVNLLGVVHVADAFLHLGSAAVRGGGGLGMGAKWESHYQRELWRSDGYFASSQPLGRRIIGDRTYGARRMTCMQVIRRTFS